MAGVNRHDYLPVEEGFWDPSAPEASIARAEPWDLLRERERERLPLRGERDRERRASCRGLAGGVRVVPEDSPVEVLVQVVIELWRADVVSRCVGARGVPPFLPWPLFFME